MGRYQAMAEGLEMCLAAIEVEHVKAYPDIEHSELMAVDLEKAYENLALYGQSRYMYAHRILLSRPLRLASDPPGAQAVHHSRGRNECDH